MTTSSTRARASTRPGTSSISTGARRPPQLRRTAPSELAPAPSDGTAARTGGTTGDDVVPAWSPSGGEIAYVGTGAFFALTRANGSVRTLAQGQALFFGGVVWAE